MAAVMPSQSAVVTLPTDTQILVTREFAAPAHLVYRAWTEPDLIARWWHARRGEVKSIDVDLQVGGKWRWAMIADGGFEVAFHGEYRELVPGERLVYTEVFEAPSAGDTPAVKNTVTFSEQDGRTSMVAVTDCPSREVRDAIMSSGMEGGMQDAYDLLEETAISLA
jgi:uncharacterized protein YndB with AHSA1/START domain